MVDAAKNPATIWLRRGLAVVLAAAGLVLALIALGLALLNIAPVREALLDTALKAARSGTVTIEIGGLDGVWPGALRISDLRIGDEEGVWLRLASAELDWRPLALWHGELHITRLDLAGLDLMRLPDAVKPATKNSCCRNCRRCPSRSGSKVSTPAKCSSARRWRARRSTLPRRAMRC